MLERRDETLKTLASLQPSKDTSRSLLTTASLGQNPLKPTSAKEREERVEDRVVKRSMEKLKRRRGDADMDMDNDSEDSDGVEVVNTVAKAEGVATTVLETKAEKRAREKAEAKGIKGNIKASKVGWGVDCADDQGELEPEREESQGRGVELGL